MSRQEPAAAPSPLASQPVPCTPGLGQTSDPPSLPSHHHIHPHPLAVCRAPHQGLTWAPAAPNCCSAQKATERAAGAGGRDALRGRGDPTAPFLGSRPAHLQPAAPVHPPHRAVATLCSTAQEETPLRIHLSAGYVSPTIASPGHSVGQDFCKLVDPPHPHWDLTLCARTSPGVSESLCLSRIILPAGWSGPILRDLERTPHHQHHLLGHNVVPGLGLPFARMLLLRCPQAPLPAASFLARKTQD